MGIGITILTFIYIIEMLNLAGIIQRVVFLESQTDAQQAMQYKLVAICSTGIFVMCLIAKSHSVISIIGFVIFIIIPFYYTSYCGRKSHKWLGILEGIPLVGYVDGTLNVIELITDHIPNAAITLVVNICILSIVLAVIGVLYAKKPRFVRILINDIHNRSLSVVEEIIIWTVGIWLFAYDTFIDEFYGQNITGVMAGYIAVLNFITAAVIVLFVIDSNYRNYYLSKNTKLQKSLINALAYTIDSKDRYTSGHSKRVANYSVELAKRLGKNEDEQRTIYNAGLLHDIGKIRVPEAVINKPGKLTDEEFDQIKIHPVSGYHTLKDIYDDKWIALGAKYHHERYDGTGYPNNLEGENIPEIARIIGVADAYDAMASNRSYRDALPQEVVRSEIEKGKGKQFDPVVADVMLQMIDEDVNYELCQKDEIYKDVLVIDDTPMNTKLVEHILKDEPVKVHCANSGEEGLKLLKEHAMDLVLLDLMMPDMDGFEVFAKLREISNAPVVFMTTDKNLDSIKKSAQMGVTDYVTKPFVPLILREIVHSIINQQE